jgi:hypothetical protein
MFQHTLDRATKLTPPDRMVTVVAHNHRHDALAQLDGSQSDPVGLSSGQRARLVREAGFGVRGSKFRQP